MEVAMTPLQKVHALEERPKISIPFPFPAHVLCALEMHCREIFNKPVNGVDVHFNTVNGMVDIDVKKKHWQIGAKSAPEVVAKLAGLKMTPEIEDVVKMFAADNGGDPKRNIKPGYLNRLNGSWFSLLRHMQEWPVDDRDKWGQEILKKFSPLMSLYYEVKINPIKIEDDEYLKNYH